MKNRFNLNDIVKIFNYDDDYKIIGMKMDTRNKPKKIWYELYRLY